VVAHSCDLSDSRKLKIERSRVRPAWEKKVRPYQKAGGVVQVAEHLPPECEALSSNPSMQKKRRKCWQGGLSSKNT
jgi:hypothetical protein